MMKQLVMSVVVAFAFGVRGAEKNDWENPEVNSINRLPPRTVRLGCPSDGTIRNGVFRNLKMRGRNGVLSGHPVRYLQDGDSGSCRMENLLVENCDIDVKASPISSWVDPGIELASFGNTTFRHVRVKGGRPISLRGSGNTLLQNVVFEDVAGMIGAEEPLAMKSVSGVVFKDFAVTSAPGEKASPAVNETDGWERVR